MNSGGTGKMTMNIEILDIPVMAEKHLWRIHKDFTTLSMIRTVKQRIVSISRFIL